MPLKKERGYRETPSSEELANMEARYYADKIRGWNDTIQKNGMDSVRSDWSAGDELHLLFSLFLKGQSDSAHSVVQRSLQNIGLSFNTFEKLLQQLSEDEKNAFLKAWIPPQD